jgi:general secretion pathway protein H
LTRPSRGFSLLELLLVLVIVGLIVSLAGLSVSSGSRPYVVEGSARVFADVAEYAMDEAQLSGIDMGLLFRQSGNSQGYSYTYQWLQRQASGWEPAVRDEEVFSAREFPTGVELRLEVEEGITELSEPIDGAGEAGSQPQVIYYSSGESTPGILTLVEADDGRILWELEWDLLGRMTLRREGRVEDEE